MDGGLISRARICRLRLGVCRERRVAQVDQKGQQSARKPRISRHCSFLPQSLLRSLRSLAHLICDLRGTTSPRSLAPSSTCTRRGSFTATSSLKSEPSFSRLRLRSGGSEADYCETAASYSIGICASRLPISEPQSCSSKTRSRMVNRSRVGFPRLGRARFTQNQPA